METIEFIEGCIQEILDACNIARRVRISGSAVSVAGGVVAIAGLALIPFTLGGSIAMSLIGGATALAGGVGSSTSTVVEMVVTKSKLNEVQNCIEMDKTLSQVIKELCEKLDELRNEQVYNYRHIYISSK